MMKRPRAQEKKMVNRPVPGFYIAHHYFLDVICGKNGTFKVGFTGDLRRRLGDSAYVTCFSEGWRYAATLETPTEDEARKIETAVLCCCSKRRVDGRELVSLPLETIIWVAKRVVALLGIDATLIESPAYELLQRERKTSAGAKAPTRGEPEDEQQIAEITNETKRDLESAGFAIPRPGDARRASSPPQTTSGGSLSTAEFVDEASELSQTLGELLELADGPLSFDKAAPLEERAYQKRAVEACCAELEKTGKAILQMACRCGKTKIGYGVIERLAGLDSVCLFLVPNLPLLRQTAQKLIAYGDVFRLDDMLLLGSDPTPVRIAKENRNAHMTTSPEQIANFFARGGRRLVLSTYQSSPLIPSHAVFELIVFDEAHRICGADTPRAFNHVLLSSLAGKRLYMTATPAFEANAISMKNRGLFGGVAFRYYLREGISGGYVNDFCLKLVASAEKDVVGNTVIVDQIVAASRAVDKLLVFCRDIKQAEVLRGAVAKLIGDDIRCLSAHSKMCHREVAEVLGEMCKKESRVVVFTCRLLQEGVEIPYLNGVFFASPRHSFRDIIQSLCRPLNRMPDKPVSTVFLPVNVNPEAEFQDPANLQRYASLVEVFDALCQEDPQLFDYLLDPANKTYPISCLGTKSLGLTSLPEKQRLLAAVRHAVRHGSTHGVKLSERMLRTEAIPWELGFGELSRIVHVCKRYPKTTDSWRVGEAVVNFHAFYRRCQEGYALWKAGKASFLEPCQIQALLGLNGWETYGAEGAYPWKMCMDFLEKWLSEHDGQPPPVEVHHGGYIGLDATMMERLSGALTCANQADGRLIGTNGKRRAKEGKSSYCLPPEKQADLKRIAEKYGLRWCKERDVNGELIKDGPKTFIQDAYEAFKAIYKKGGAKDPYITKWFPGYPLKHKHQEDPTVSKEVLPPRYRTEKQKKLAAGLKTFGRKAGQPPSKEKDNSVVPAPRENPT